ncbi:MAG: peptidase [Chitinophagaceae bacterium]|nr:peptidase [Chitinophagaceae bacterium]
MIIPPYLKKGDTIGLVCPSGYMPAANFQTCVDVLQQWGFQVKLGKTPGKQFHYFSGTDEERLADLQEMLDDPEVNAILCARGGYGLSRIIDDLSFKKFAKRPKWLIGFSDITVLHAHIFQHYKIATMHAPMAAAFNEEGYRNPYVESLRDALYGKPGDYSAHSNPANRQGNCTGRLVGGNLALVAHLVGSDSSFATRNKILFLEDVGEYLYNVDRMMIQLKRAGMLDQLAGIIFGGFTEMKDTAMPFGSTVYDILQHQVKAYDYPVCFDFPVSHDKENYCLKVGVKYTLDVGMDTVRLIEKA